MNTSATAPDIGFAESIGAVDEVLGGWRDVIGKDYAGYRNHVCRVVHYCFALRDCSEEDRHKVIIAACFHDLGIWSANTSNYLPPSEALAGDYLRQRGIEHWIQEIELMIDRHHKLRTYRDGRYPLVEVLREADLVDVSLGIQKFGLPGAYVRDVKRQFPNAGFHWRLVKLLGQGLRRRPWNPLPIFKW